MASSRLARVLPIDVGSSTQVRSIVLQITSGGAHVSKPLRGSESNTVLPVSDQAFANAFAAIAPVCAHRKNAFSPAGIRGTPGACTKQREWTGWPTFQLQDRFAIRIAANLLGDDRLEDAIAFADSSHHHLGRRLQLERI